MKTETSNTPHLDHFFSTSAARLDRWRELNAKAQAWAAEAQTGKARSGRAAVEAAFRRGNNGRPSSCREIEECARRGSIVGGGRSAER